MRIVFFTNTFTWTAVMYIQRLIESKKDVVGILLLSKRAKCKKGFFSAFAMLRKYGAGIILKRIRKTFYLHLRYAILSKLRGKSNIDYLSVEELSLRYKLRLFVIDDINSQSTRQILKGLVPDVIFVCTFSQIIKGEVIRIPKYGCINIHAGLLPEYRGPASNFWVLFNKESMTGVTFHYLTEGIDNGDIVLQKELAILSNDSEDTLDIRLAKLGSASICEIVERIERGALMHIPQREQEASYFSQPTIMQRRLFDKIRKSR